MNTIYIVLLAYGVSGGPNLEPAIIAPEARPAVATYEKCVVDQSLSLEPAGEPVSDTVRVSKLACIDEQTAATRALLGKYSLTKPGPDNDGQMRAVDSVIRCYSDAEDKAQLAVMTQRARKAK